MSASSVSLIPTAANVPPVSATPVPSWEKNQAATTAADLSPPAPRARDHSQTSLRSMRLHEQVQPLSTREKRGASTTGMTPANVRRRFPEVAAATKADATLQKNLVQWLHTGHSKENPVPKNASITPFIEQYLQAINDPDAQAWFTSKGLKPSTVRVFSDSVTGIVMRDGKQTFQRFSCTDGSGWGLAGRGISAIQKVLSPGDLGLAVIQDPPQHVISRDVLLDFYGVQPPLNEKSAPHLGKQLKKAGWPALSATQREQWGDQFKQLSRSREDASLRVRLVEQLLPSIKGKPDDETLRLGDVALAAQPGSTLDQQSNKPRKLFVDFLATPAFQAFLNKTGFEKTGSEFRLSTGELQMRDGAGRWVSLQRAFDDEVGKVSGAGSTEEQAVARKMSADLDHVVKLSKKTGNSLYSTRRYDVRQALALHSAEKVQTVGQLRAMLGWLNTQLPQPPLAGDYAGLTPYGHGPNAVSDTAVETLKGTSAQVMALFTGFSARWSGFESFPDPDSQLAAFFDSPPAIALAETLAKSLALYAVIDGQALPKADRHQLLAATLKLSVDAPIPGKPGSVAGYGLYQPANMGRTLKAVRADVERHLQSKGVDATVCSLMAHLFLAQSAPEMLVRKDPAVPAASAQLQNQAPELIKVGSTGWLTMRLGCALADALGAAGNSRSMNLAQILALSRLEAVGPEQETLIKQLAAQPLLDWAVMTGVFPAASDGRYSAGDYQAAAKAFTERENRTREAFETLMRESPTQTNLLVKQLVLLFPEMTEDEIGTIKLDNYPDFDLSQNAGLKQRSSARSQKLLTDVILMNQALGDPVLGTQAHWTRDTVIHPKVSFAIFRERLKQLPMIAPLVAPAVDHYITDARTAQATALKLMFAQLPLEDRKALALGKIEFFSVREATGEDLKADKGADSKVAGSKGTHGLLMRYETGAVEPRFGYFEVFPGALKMIKRTDLPDQLPLGGKVEAGKKPFGPFAHVNTRYQRGTAQPFDFEAYKTGSAPRPGETSTVIIERYGKALAEAPSSTNTHGRIPDTFASSRTSQLVSQLQAHSFLDDRTARIAHANEPTALHKRHYPFSTSKVFTAENARLILSLIPFVGAIADWVDGDAEAGVKGLLIDLASVALTGGFSGAKRVAKGLKMLIPFSGKPFSMAGLKGTGTFFRGLFNPLESIPEILRSGPSVVNALKMLAKGQTVRLGANIYLPVKAFEQWRWAMGARDSALAGSGRSPSQWPGARMGASADREVYAVQKNGGWYAINPVSGKPEGAPLEQFIPQPG